jgi:hypothetical protein
VEKGPMIENGLKQMDATQRPILSEFQFLDQQNAQVSNFTSF